jgi:hypothetical protein
MAYRNVKCRFWLGVGHEACQESKDTSRVGR